MIEAIFELEDKIFENPFIDKELVVKEVAKKYGIKSKDLLPYFDLFAAYKYASDNKKLTLQKRIVWTLEERLIINYFVSNVICAKTQKFKHLAHILRFTERTKESISFDYYNNVAPDKKQKQLKMQMKNAKLTNWAENNDGIEKIENKNENNNLGSMVEETLSLLDNRGEEDKNLQLDEKAEGKIEYVQLNNKVEEVKNEQLELKDKNVENDFLSNLSLFVKNSKTLSAFNLEEFFQGLTMLSSLAAEKVGGLEEKEVLEAKVKEQEEIIKEMKAEIEEKEELKIKAELQDGLIEELKTEMKEVKEVLEVIYEEIEKFDDLDSIEKVVKLKDFSDNLKIIKDKKLKLEVEQKLELELV